MLDLETVFLAARSKSEITAFLKLLLTAEEMDECRNRWKACQMATKGVTQREIRDRLGVGLATATRAARTARQHARTIQRLAERKKYGVL